MNNNHDYYNYDAYISLLVTMLEGEYGPCAFNYVVEDEDQDFDDEDEKVCS